MMRYRIYRLYVYRNDVYLQYILLLLQDVYEIRFGFDWQDFLNYVVSNCEFFVFLVILKYGEIQWINREVSVIIVSKVVEISYKFEIQLVQFIMFIVMLF